MDPANETPFHVALERQGSLLGRHEEELTTTRRVVESLAEQMSELSTQFHRLRHEASVPSRSPDSPEPRINNPPCYSGEPTQCRAFLTQCEVIFSLQPSTYSRDRAKVAYVISLLSGRARQWGAANWEAEADFMDCFSLFKEEMIRVFDRSAHGAEASRLLSSLRQGRLSVADFSIEFRTLATTAGWNEPALVARFLEGLNADVKDEIFAREVPSLLDPLIDLAIRIEKRFDSRRRARNSDAAPHSLLPFSSVPSSPVADATPEPMQLGGLRISSKERDRRISNRLCLYCGSDKHFVSTCPLKANARQ
jgi:hypothetical protein